MDAAASIGAADELSTLNIFIEAFARNVHSYFAQKRQPEISEELSKKGIV